MENHTMRDNTTRENTTRKNTMRKKRKDPVKIVLGVSAGVLFCVSAFFAVRYVDLLTGDTVPQPALETTDTSEVQEAQAALEATLLEKERAITALEAQLAALNEKVQLLENTEAVQQAQQLTAQTAQIAELKTQLAAMRAEADTYRSQLTALQTKVDTDWGTRSRLLSELYVMLTHDAPLLTPEEEELSETTTTETKEKAETEPVDPKEAWEAMYPTISLYYQDLTSGYSVTYNENKVLYSASLIKAPYVYAVLREIEDFEEQKRNYANDGTPLYDENGQPLFTGKHPNLDENGNILYKEGEEKYDLSRTWTYDPETMKEEGSGKIQYEQKGFTLTWKELFEYTLLYSDNVAFRQLRDTFGMTSFQALATELSFQGTSYGFMQLTAKDCGKFLETLYGFFVTESTYATWMQELMCRSAHTVMIPAAVSPTKAAHKYGWDENAYHDMAVVLDEDPYILVIMTTLEDGGSTVDSYIRSLVQQCKRIHADVAKERSAVQAEKTDAATE